MVIHRQGETGVPFSDAALRTREMPDLAIYDDCEAMLPGPGSWMMHPAGFSRGVPGEYRGYRAAGDNLYEPYRTGGIFVAQNAVYASSYQRPEPLEGHGSLWRIRMDLRSPAIVRERVLHVTSAIIAALPRGTDSIVMPWGDSNMGNGPVIILLDRSLITEAQPAWTPFEVTEAIQGGRLDDIPDEVLADYPCFRQRIGEMRERWSTGRVPWHRF
jgi:hypothetical protein